jgi:uncharacterized protein
MLRIVLSACFGLSLLLLWTGCDQGDGPENPPADNEFDRAAMLQHYSDAVILPALADFRQQATLLSSDLETYLQDPTETHWEQARNQWLLAITAWQGVQTYNFGPGETSRGSLFEKVGTWPVNVSQLETYVSAGDTSLANFDRDTRGLLGIEYLLFAENARDALSNDPNRQAYLHAVVRNVATEAIAVDEAWRDSYASSFTSSDGISAGSPTSLLYNNFVLAYERLKNFKIGVPAGLRAGQTDAAPELVEAYYSGESLALMREQFDQTVALWKGNGSSDGIGFKEYLLAVEGGQQLVTETEAQIQAVYAALDAMPGDQSLAGSIEQSMAAVTDLHTELQRLTRFFKSEMSSRLSIAITYDSGDGD